jgi:hypothetical protein
VDIMTQLLYSAEPTYTDILNADLVQDKPVTQTLLVNLQHNTLFAAVRLEWFKMGWYQHGDTVPAPASPIDGHAYTYAETIFVPILGSSRQPKSGTDPISGLPYFTSGQDTFPILADSDIGTGFTVLLPYILKIIPATGVLTCQMYFNGSGAANQGSVYVYAACQRLLGTLIFADGPPTFVDSIGGNALEQLVLGGNPLTVSAIRALKDNARFGAACREVFDHGYYADGNTIALPVSTIDGYTYSRAECLYLPLLASARQPNPGSFTPGQSTFPTLNNSDAGSGNLLECPRQLLVTGSTGALTSKMYFSTSGVVGQGTVRVVILAQRQSVQAQA